MDTEGTIVCQRQLRRSQVLAFFLRLEPCLVGMEACAGAHYWARELTAVGHEVRLMPPAYVKPCVKRGEADAVDTEAICEAVSRPTMRFVPVKSADRQVALLDHMARDFMVRQRTIVNAIRAHLGEFGAVTTGKLRPQIAFPVGMLCAESDLTLKELAGALEERHGVTVHLSSIHPALIRAGFSYKKGLIAQESARADIRFA